MKKLFVLLLMIVGIGVCAWGNVGVMLLELIDADCISAAELQLILTAVTGPCPAILSVEGECTTIGELSSYLYDALGLRGTLLERLFGMSMAEKTRVCQRNNMMVEGVAGDILTGFDLAAIITGVTRYLVHMVDPPSCVVLDRDALLVLLERARALLPPGVLQELMPGLYPAPPTS